MMRREVSILILLSLPGASNTQAEIQRRAYSQPDYSSHDSSESLILGQQGEHTKDAVYIDSERRFQELEKVCHYRWCAASLPQ